MTLCNVDYDVLIVGGGMVGASLACALGGTSLKVGVVEAYPFGASDQPSYDDRSIALAYGSRRIIEGIGLWPQIRSHVTQIKKIHISDRGHFGFARLDCDDYHVDALGYVVELRVMGAVLAQALAALPNVDLLSPVRVTGLTQAGDHAQLHVEKAGEAAVLTTRLVVAADGDKSFIRQLMNIATDREEYDQTAIIANVTPSKPHEGIAYERFTDSGPLALLPLTEQRCSLVWTLRPQEVDEVMALNDADFLARLQARFGFRLGRFEHVGRRQAYPLALVRAREQVVERVALIGNAAHTLHPVAGQGFNLGIRDVAALAQVIVDHAKAEADIGGATVLREYAQWRVNDHREVIGFTDTLARLFANDAAPLVWARDTSLIALDLLPSLKGLLARRTMGVAGKQPRLARVLTL